MSGSKNLRLSSHRWEKLRKQILFAEPRCRRCREKGRTRLASVVDHAVPLALGGSNDPENLRPLCEVCHKVVTEEQFGKRVRPETGLDGWPV